MTLTLSLLVMKFMKSLEYIFMRRLKKDAAKDLPLKT